MTEGNRKLLVKDLCARQMHNVKCRVKYSFNNETTNGRDVWTEEDDTIKMVNPEYEEVLTSYVSEWVDIENVKPYLRPMSSMTEEEYNKYEQTFDNVVVYSGHNNNNIHSEHRPTYETFDYLDSIHVDYRGLIPMGLALEAPEDMYEI